LTTDALAQMRFKTLQFQEGFRLCLNRVLHPSI
jgi:hypothetical protein